MTTATIAIGGEEWPSINIFSVETARASMRAFFQIASAWGLNEEEQQALLGVPQATLAQWHDGKFPEGLPVATLERVSHVLNIYSALHTLLPDPRLADDWPHRPNSAPPFGGNTAITKLVSGSLADLQCVAQYLRSQTDGDF